jgi:ABC-type bacteriocin/lantibiotic exporter with double-glycine peptidase domain
MATETTVKSPSKSEKRKSAWKSLPDVWALMKPRRGLLAIGFMLMAINRLSGLVLPASTKYLIDNVIGQKQIRLLTPIVLAVLTATVIQGLTSFTLTQLLRCDARFRHISDGCLWRTTTRIRRARWFRES